MADSEASRTIVSDAYSALLSGDFKRFLGVFDPEIELSEPACLPYGGTYKGMKEVMGMFGQAGPYLDSGAMVVEHVIADGDRVSVLLTIPLRDGSAKASMVENWLLRDGKAVELKVYWADPTIVSAAA